MKTMKKIIAIMAVIATVISCFAVTASAKNVCSEVSGYAYETGGNSDTFRVIAKDTKSHSLKMKMTKGKLEGCDMMRCSIFDKSAYGFYEIKIYSVKNNKADKLLNKYNVKNKSNHTINLQGYKEYEVRVYNWKTDTIVKNQNWFSSIVYSGFSYFHWTAAPTWKISKTSGVSYCR